MNPFVLRSPLYLLMAGLMSLFSLVGCAWETVDERIEQLTREQPNARRQQAARRLALAQAYYEQGQWQTAHQEVRASLLIDANQAQAYSLLGLIYQQESQPELAQRSFEAALALLTQPDAATRVERALISHNYAWFLCEQQRSEEAMALWQEVLALPQYPQRIKTWQAMGLCLLKGDQIEQARSYFELVLGEQIWDLTANYQLAKADFLQNHLAQAQTRLNRLHRRGIYSAHSLWLAIRICQQTQSTDEQLALEQLLRQQFPQSDPVRWLDQLSFDQL